MAEEIKLGVEADKNAIYLYDETGVYDVDCNSGGWGSPNLEPSDIEEATVEVFIPKSDSGIIIDVSDALPNATGLGLEVLAQELGLEFIPSGVWRFVYRLKSTTESFEQAVSISKYFDENTACCVDSMLGKFDTLNPVSENNKSIVETEILFDSARWLACKGKTSGAQKVITHVDNKCKCCN